MYDIFPLDGNLQLQHTRNIMDNGFDTLSNHTRFFYIYKYKWMHRFNHQNHQLWITGNVLFGIYSTKYYLNDLTHQTLYLIIVRIDCCLTGPRQNISKTNRHRYGNILRINVNSLDSWYLESVNKMVGGRTMYTFGSYFWWNAGGSLFFIYVCVRCWIKLWFFLPILLNSAVICIACFFLRIHSFFLLTWNNAPNRFKLFISFSFIHRSYLWLAHFIVYFVSIYVRSWTYYAYYVHHMNFKCIHGIWTGADVFRCDFNKIAHEFYKKCDSS